MILLIDNYDSFTFNLYQALGELGATVNVRYNDQVRDEDLAGTTAIVISPGPGNPDQAGQTLEIVRGPGKQASDPRRLPWPSVHRAGIRREDRACAAPHARQDLSHLSRRSRAV